MLAARLAYQQGRLAVTPLRDTLNRQSGMYAITKRITDLQADTLIGAFCRTEGGCQSGCLKPSSGPSPQPSPSPPSPREIQPLPRL